jgi:hypothetical protein
MWASQITEADLIRYRFSKSATAKREQRLALAQQVARHPLNVEHGLLNRAGQSRRFAMRFMQLGYRADINELDRSRAYREESTSLRMWCSYREVA